MSVERFGEKVSFIWSVADLLRGPYKPPQYGEVMLPLTVLRRLDCVLSSIERRRRSMRWWRRSGGCSG